MRNSGNTFREQFQLAINRISAGCIEARGYNLRIRGLVIALVYCHGLVRYVPASTPRINYERASSYSNFVMVWQRLARITLTLVDYERRPLPTFSQSDRDQLPPVLFQRRRSPESQHACGLKLWISRLRGINNAEGSPICYTLPITGSSAVEPASHNMIYQIDPIITPLQFRRW